MSAQINKSTGPIWQAAMRHKKTYAVLLVFGFVINILMLSPSIYMMQVYDRVLSSRNETTLVLLTVMIAFLYLGQALLEMFRSLTLVRISEQLDHDLSERVFRASYERNLRAGGSSPSIALGDLNQIRQFLTGPGLTTFLDVPWLPIYLIVLFMIDSALGWLCIVGGIILFGLAWLNEKATHSSLQQANASNIRASTFANNHLRNVEVIEAMGMLPALIKRWRGEQGNALELQAKASNKGALISAASRFIRILLQSAGLCVGAYLVLQGTATGGVMIAASILVGKALSPIEQIISSWKFWLQARGAWERLDKLLTDFPARAEKMPLGRPNGEISVENLYAGAPGQTGHILKAIQFKLPAGQALGVIGPSGSGKSTLAKLIAGIWRGQMGTVRLAGADVFDWSKEELGQYVGYLPQDIELFPGTVSQNIARFGELDAEAVITAAKLAGIHELILRLPKGYDSELGEGGCNLSGGQRQRIALARAIFGNPALLILDEPNSNLDEDGEQCLAKSIQELKQKGTTIILVTHRASILDSVDQILILKEGQMVKMGPKQAFLQAPQTTQ